MKGKTSNLPTEQRVHAPAHFFSGGDCVGKRENLLRLGVALMDEASDALDENRSLSSASSRNDQHRSVNVLNGFFLVTVGSKWNRFQFGISHRGPEYHR